MSWSAANVPTKPTGWADFSRHGHGRWHWFGADGESLCGRYVNDTRNLLCPDKDVHVSMRCKMCQKRHASKR